MAGQRAGTSPDFDVRDVIDGVALLASTANVVMQLARPAVGYGVVESTVESGQVMRHPFRRIRKTIAYLSVAFMGTSEERQICRREVNRSHVGVRSTAGSPVSYSAFDPRLQMWVAACLYRGVIDTGPSFWPAARITTLSRRLAASWVRNGKPAILTCGLAGKPRSPTCAAIRPCA